MHVPSVWTSWLRREAMDTEDAVGDKGLCAFTCVLDTDEWDVNGLLPEDDELRVDIELLEAWYLLSLFPLSEVFLSRRSFLSSRSGSVQTTSHMLDWVILSDD